MSCSKYKVASNLSTYIALRPSSMASMETQLMTAVGSALVGGVIAYLVQKPRCAPIRRIGILAAMPAEVAKLKSAVEEQVGYQTLPTRA